MQMTLSMHHNICFSEQQGYNRDSTAHLFSYFMGKGSSAAMKGSGGGADTALPQPHGHLRRGYKCKSVNL